MNMTGPPATSGTHFSGAERTRMSSEPATTPDPPRRRCRSSKRATERQRARVVGLFPGRVRLRRDPALCRPWVLGAIVVVSSRSRRVVVRLPVRRRVFDLRAATDHQAFDGHPRLDERDVSSEGTVAAAQTDDLSFSSSGTVTAVNVKAGDTVHGGPGARDDRLGPAPGRGELGGSRRSPRRRRSSPTTRRRARRRRRSPPTRRASPRRTTRSTQRQAGAGRRVARRDVRRHGRRGQPHRRRAAGERRHRRHRTTGSGSGSGQSSSTLGSSNGRGLARRRAAARRQLLVVVDAAQIQVVSKGQYTVTLSVGSSDIDRAWRSARP